jgi:hypothetical protein
MMLLAAVATVLGFVARTFGRAGRVGDNEDEHRKVENDDIGLHLGKLILLRLLKMRRWIVLQVVRRSR